MRILRQTKTKIDLEFDSLAQFGAIDATMTAEQSTYRSSQKENDSDWNGCSFSEAVRMSVEGWDAGRDRLVKLTESGIQQLDRDVIPVEVRGVAGYRPDVPAYCTGAPDCMVMRDEEVKPAVLRLLVDFGNSHKVTADQIMNYGAALLAYIEAIEAEGIRCELWAGIKATRSRTAFTARVKVKDPDQPFDFGAIAFALSHPAMLRRLYFRAVEQFADMWSGEGQNPDAGFTNGYGSPATYPLDLFDGDTIFRVPAINDTHKQCRTLDGALKVFKAQIKNVLRSYSQYEIAA
jgi:hypothetical protein